MPDPHKKFHEFALKSGLFKGRYDWYFCYVKAERIAHVLAVLSGRADYPILKDISTHAQTLPGDIARMAAGEFDVSAILAELFSLLSSVRLAGTAGYIHQDNCAVLVREYEMLAERIVAGGNPSPFGSAEEFLTSELPPEPLSLGTRPDTSGTIKDIKDMRAMSYNKGHKTQEEPSSARISQILEHLRKNKNASIKDIAATVRGCSEKTIQRDLNDLIHQGRVRRVGSRRWSTYELA